MIRAPVLKRKTAAPIWREPHTVAMLSGATMPSDLR